MGDTALKISSKRTEISLLQAQIIALQMGCTHRMRVVSQEHSNGEIPQTCAKIECQECGVTEKKQTQGPLCPAHVVEMVRSHELAVKDLVAKRNEELRKQRGYYSAFGWKCPHEGCNEIKVLDQWDQ